MGSVVKAKVGYLKKITREGRSRKIREEVVGCVQSVLGKKKFLVKFEDGQKRDISSYVMVFLSSEEGVEMDEPISHLPEK